ncbi:MAG: recombination mediator RecR [Firmicutes bacterium]|nr:recombination mediator RecR [Bacillota bacterium]
MTNLDSINTLINFFTKLPGVGYKTAQRYAYYIIETDNAHVRAFSDALVMVKEKVKFCVRCGNFTDTDTCVLCTRRSKDSGIICVVKDPRDVIAIEKSGAFNGTYHVLHGVISPLDRKGPNDINLKTLLVRVREEQTEEVIIATNPDVEGEATANYIASLLKPSGIKITRLAQGLSLGSALEYADEMTLGAAINNRNTI